MKKLDINQLDDSDEEIVEILISSGMSRPAARTLAYLQKVDKSTSVDLERVTGLRQPEVSIAMKELKPFDWIDENEEKKPGKGRPNKVYSLKVGFKDIIAYIEKQQKKAIDDGMASIRRLKELRKG
ncbi:MAG: ArsR family transcriptional regulator [Candidatus Methanoperedenaceae archaeon]|nr:ArsR family transcriptional regulator [Candidatus Methanoperedenaceae archaeon]MDW7728210.1 transcriptional regulator protein [Candidatus Methanoperedens sp.]